MIHEGEGSCEHVSMWEGGGREGRREGSPTKGTLGYPYLDTIRHDTTRHAPGGVDPPQVGEEHAEGLVERAVEGVLL